MNLKEIKELIDLITEKNLAEFEMEKAGFKIKIVRSHPPGASAAPVVTTVAAEQGASAANPIVTTHFGKESPVLPGLPVDRGDVVALKSPIVGTFYRAPDPNASPFVKEGDRVAKGQTLCIVEAMKLMNEIESETDGEVTKILVENGQPVEFGQELFLLKPAT